MSDVLREWLREERGRQTRLADQIGVNSGYLSEVANGKKDGSLQLFRQIAEATGLPFGDLAGGLSARQPLLSAPGLGETPIDQIIPARLSDRLTAALTLIYPQVIHLSHYTATQAHPGFAIAAGDLLVIEAKFDPETIAPGHIALARKASEDSVETVLGRVMQPWLTDQAGIPIGRLDRDTSVIGLLQGIVRGNQARA